MKKKFLSVLLLIAPIVTFAQEKGLDQKIDEAFQCPGSEFIFYQIFGSGEMPFVLVLLVLGSNIFTFYFKFPNIRYFRTAINIVRGKYDDIRTRKCKIQI